MAFDLLRVMFSFDPTLRPSAAEVLDHSYFKEEEPAPMQALELKDLEGDWHEFESKALRKEKERGEREARRVAREGEKRRGSPMGEEGERDVKKIRLEQVNGLEIEGVVVE